MSKLREKFDNNVGYDENGIDSKVCEQIADDFAVKFAMHISTHCNCELGNDTSSYTELLQIFKDKYYGK